MRRRSGLRARTDFRVIARDGCLSNHCRGVEISPSGILIDRGRPVGRHDERVLVRLEMRLPERLRPLFALARPVWSVGTFQAFKFIRISDADRLSLAEHLDLAKLRGAVLS